jgi:hypothetical protein
MVTRGLQRSRILGCSGGTQYNSRYNFRKDNVESEVGYRRYASAADLLVPKIGRTKNQQVSRSTRQMAEEGVVLEFPTLTTDEAGLVRE